MAFFRGIGKNLNGYYSLWTNVNHKCINTTMSKKPNCSDKNLQCLGDLIRSLRQKRGWTQEGFASLCQLDRSYVGGIERGERNITIATLCQIAKTLGVTVSSLTINLPLDIE